jgi:hypothetical protein
MIKTFLIIVFTSSLNALFSQSFFLKANGKFQSRKIAVENTTSNQISIQVQYVSSARCACEETEEFVIMKNENGEFTYNIYDNPENTIKIIFKDNQVYSIKVHNLEDYQCCSIASGDYFLKPK